MRSTGLTLSFRWLELHRRQFWVGILTALYFIQFIRLLFLLFNRVVDWKEWFIIFTLIIVVKINQWRMANIINLFNQYRGNDNQKSAHQLFSSQTRWLLFLIGLPIGYGLVLLLSKVFMLSEAVLITIVAVLISFDLILIPFSMINDRLNNWLDYYTPNGSRYRLLRQRPQLRGLVNLVRFWQWLINCFNMLLAWLMMITARLLRLWAEGLLIRCQYKGCAKQFENPKLHCRHKRGHQTCSGQVWTWPSLAAPLFTFCNQSQCQRLYPTWQPVADLVVSGELSFQYEPCQFGSNCQNLGLNQTVRFYRILLICLDGASAALALEKISHWFGMTPNTPQPFVQIARLADQQKRIRLPQHTEVIHLGNPLVTLEITLLNSLTNTPLWAGGYHWVVVVPKYGGDNKQQLAMEAKFAFSRVELPATPATEHKAAYQPPNIMKRLFGQPRHEELTSGRGIPPNLGIWSPIELLNNIHPTLPVYSVLYIRGFENFIRGLRQ